MAKDKSKDNNESGLPIFGIDKIPSEKIKKEKIILKRQKKEELHINKYQLDVIYQISQLLTLGPNLKKILCLVLKRIEKKMRVLGIAAWLKDEGGAYSIAAVCNLPPLYVQFSRSKKGKLKKGEGLVGLAVENKKPVFAKDALKSPAAPAHYLEQVRKEKIKMGALLCVPLFSKKEVIGVLNFYFSETREKITRTDLFFLSNVTNQVATFIQNSKILRALQLNKEKAQGEKNQLANLQEAVQFLSLNTDQSLQDILAGLFNTLGKALGCYALAIWKTDENFLRIFTSKGLSKDYYDHFIKNPISILDPAINNTAMGRAAITLRPAFLPNFWRDPGVRSLPRSILDAVQKESFNSVAAFPLIVKGKLFGVLNFYFLKTQKYPTSKKYIFRVAANTMSIAIDNAQYRQASRDAQAALLNVLEDTEAARDKIEEERRKTEIIITNFSDGLLFFDAENKLFLINPQAEAFLDLRGENMMGKSISELDSLPAFASFINFLGKDLKSVFRKEFSVKESLTVELSVISMDTDRGKFGNLVILHDITRAKIVERLKTEFVSLSAHQLRTPLSAIKWTLRMLLDGDLGNLTDDQRNFIDKTYQSNERMITLINNLLDVTRIEEGRYLYKPALADIESVIQFAIDSYADTIKEKSLKIEFKKPIKKISGIIIDVEKMRLAVQNLIDNAVKYTTSGSTIDISLAYDENKEEIEVQIQDAGMGIPRGQQSRVFTKFFRADNASRADTTGSGLGLFIAKNIIEAHGGKIWFKSPVSIKKNAAGKEEEENGTIFYFTLPAKKEFNEFLKWL